jgi:predicted kinase
MPKAYILVGIPCSGKSTWTKEYEHEQEFVLGRPLYIISRDKYRYLAFGPNYKQNKTDENFITVHSNRMLEKYTLLEYDIIIDNTHCKQEYIDEVIAKIPEGYEIEIKYFDIPLWKAKIRNILRRIKTGKWIPWKVMEAMYKNYKKLKRNE